MADAMRQPLLAGNGLILRPLAAADWRVLFAVASDPAIWAGHPAPDRWHKAVALLPAKAG